MQIKKTIALLFLLFAGAVSYAQNTTTTVARTPYKQISPNKIAVTSTISQKLLQQIQKGDAYLIDVRTPEDYSAGHLQYAKNLNIRSADFGNHLNTLDKSKPIYLYCHSGNRSGKATDSLLTLGYKKSYNIGGLDSLKKYGFPVAK